MTYQQMRVEYEARYGHETDPEIRTALDLIAKADSLSEAAQREFVKAFTFDFALTGEIYLGGKRTAAAVYPHLLAEAPAAGITTVTR